MFGAMARYIDANRLKRTFASGIRVYDGMCKIADVMHNIENEPTADVMEVVRCKDCFKAQETGERWGEQYKYFCKRHHSFVLENDFCSYGKKEGVKI